MQSYVINDQEIDFGYMKGILDARLAKARRLKQKCSYGTRLNKSGDSYNTDHIYAFFPG